MLNCIRFLIDSVTGALSSRRTFTLPKLKQNNLLQDKIQLVALENSNTNTRTSTRCAPKYNECHLKTNRQHNECLLVAFLYCVLQGLTNLVYIMNLFTFHYFLLKKSLGSRREAFLNNPYFYVFYYIDKT